jgi:hypothetical protein
MKRFLGEMLGETADRAIRLGSGSADFMVSRWTGYIAPRNRAGDLRGFKDE